jgi:CheY-like chemotaxis protein
VEGKRILIVDDIELNVRLLGETLALQGAHVVTALRAEDGLELARQTQPDLILMDLQMPELDGLTATRRLKADPQTAHIPVVAVTAAAMEEDRERAFAAGCEGFLAKPVDVNALAGQLAAVLAQRRQ